MRAGVVKASVRRLLWGKLKMARHDAGNGQVYIEFIAGNYSPRRVMSRGSPWVTVMFRTTVFAGRSIVTR